MFTRRARAAWPAAAAPMATLVTLVGLGAAACGATHATAGTGAGAASGSSGSPSARAGGVPSSSLPAPSLPASSLPAPGRAPTPPRGPGPVIPVTTSCTGWPSAPWGKLTASFTPASVLRCVTSYANVPGKGDRTTVTLERATTGLTPLANALRAPSTHNRPGMMCPMFVMPAPQIVLIAADGKTLRPQFPVNGCGQIQPQVLAALGGLHWQIVSQRVIQ